MVPDRIGSTVSSTSTGRDMDDQDGTAETGHRQNDADLGTVEVGKSLLMSGASGQATQPAQTDTIQSGEASTTLPISGSSSLRVTGSKDEGSDPGVNTILNDLQDPGMRMSEMDAAHDRDSAIDTGKSRRPVDRPNANGSQ